jgi:hypothetical protein
MWERLAPTIVFAVPFLSLTLSYKTPFQIELYRCWLTAALRLNKNKRKGVHL